jgi:hypothetical protein
MSKRILLLIVLIGVILVNTMWNQTKMTQNVQRSMIEVPTIRTIPISNTQKPRIAIISSFLMGGQSSTSKVKDLDHLINKACYAKLWGYDFIFNMTYGFDKQVDEEQGGAYWLNYGTWHRVPHIRDRINDYDWVLYADTDYIFHDMKTPLDSFFKNWEFHGLDPSVFVPKDFDDHLYTFSAFVVLIKNDPFGRRLLDYWMEFGRGICTDGNLVAKPRPYTWEDSDQPGLWYALTQTHKEFFPSDNITTKPICNETSGLIDTSRAFGHEMNRYFSQTGVIMGSDGSELRKVPIEQPIIWSRPNIISLGGIGTQLKWGRSLDDKLLEEFTRGIFAFHRSDVRKWPNQSKINLDICKRVHGCYANYTRDGSLQIGCDGVRYAVATS